MATFEHQLLVVSAGAAGQDRAAVFPSGRDFVAVVADGAGGTSGGAAAAEHVIEAVRRVCESGDKHDWRRTLLKASVELESIGQTTAVIASSRGGASVGDSGAWLIGENDYVDLTEGQPRKPLLGGGVAEPRTFRFELTHDRTLLLASDGLFKYVKPADICALARTRSAVALVEAARLSTGALQDDVAVVLVYWRLGRPFDSDAGVEQWLRAVLPDYAFDGVVVDIREAERIAGIAWQLPAGIHPFELRLSPNEVQLSFGDVAWPEGYRKRPAAGHPHEWLVRRVIAC